MRTVSVAQKCLVFTMMVLLVSIPVVAEAEVPRDSADVWQGTADGTAHGRAAGSKLSYIRVGCGLLATRSVDTPSPARLTGKSPAYKAAYTAAYREAVGKAFRKHLLIFSAIGVGTAVVLYASLYMLSALLVIGGPR